MEHNRERGKIFNETVYGANTKLPGDPMGM